MEEPTVVECVSISSDVIKLSDRTLAVQLCRGVVLAVRVELLNFL
jgi:hypothetical protein